MIEYSWPYRGGVQMYTVVVDDVACGYFLYSMGPKVKRHSEIWRRVSLTCTCGFNST